MVLPGDLQSCRHQHTAVKTGHNAGILAVHPTVRFSRSSANHPVNRESHSPSVANTFLPSGSRFLIAFSSVKLAPGYTDSCSLILPG